jgi:hypothetical protein
MKYILCYTKNFEDKRRVKYFRSLEKANNFVSRKKLCDWVLYRERIYLLDKTYFVSCGIAEKYWNNK